MKKAVLALLTLGLVLTQDKKDDKKDEQSLPKFWCWTKPAPAKDAKNWDPKKGGPNWGFCSNPEEALNEKVDYLITVKTSNIDGAGAKGAFQIQMWGNDGRTDEIPLTGDGFAQGASTKIKVSAPRIGDPFKIKLIYKGNERFRCQEVKVTAGAKFWDFDCGEWLQCPKMCSEEMILAGRSKYEVEVKTRGTIGAGTKAPLFIKLLGTLGDTTRKILVEDGLEQGSTETIEVLGKDIGDICGVKINMNQHDIWSPEKIKVTKEGGDSKEWKDLKVSIMCPVTCEIKLKTKCGPPRPKATPRKRPKSKKKAKTDKDTSDAEDDEEDPPEPEEEDSPDPDELMNNYQGAGLAQSEKDKIMTLSCDTIIKDDDDFGAPFTDARINHQLFLGFCPAGCANTGDSKAKGLGIHPDDSSICKSALIDGAIPITGGLVGIGTYVGINNYDKSHGKVNGVEAGKNKGASKSFSVIKVDNIDMCDLDMRIMNDKGQPDYMGRVEFRLDGRWGTICAKGIDQSAARRICRDLKYKDGKVLNPADSGEDFCKSIMGENYCGVPDQYIHFQAMSCEGHESNIMECTRELADEKCSHSDDTIIECSMINFDVEQPPADKTIRLMDDKGAASSQGSGRLEIYMGKWGTICSYDFDDNAAKVACIQMGYDSGKIIGGVAEQGVCSNFNEKDFCGTGSINMVHVKCKGNEAKIEQCSFRTWPFVWRCGHDYDQIVSCDGLKGDPSGKSQQPILTPMPPKLGKLPLVPIIKGNCIMTFEEKIFKGDPGSVFLIHCPKACLDSNGAVYGTAIYAPDSSICRAAIHAGVLQHYGGLIEVASAWGQEQYEGSLNRDIDSVDYQQTDRAFIIIKPNSIAIRLAQSFQGRDPVTSCENCKSFIQEKAPSLVTSGPSFRFRQDSHAKSRLLSDPNYPHFLESSHHMDTYMRDPAAYHQAQKDSLALQARHQRIQKMVHRLKKLHRSGSFLQFSFFAAVKKLFQKPKKKSSEKPVFSWWPEPNFEFMGKERDIQTNIVGMEGEDKTGNLKAFSLAIKFKQMDVSMTEMTLVSHSNCGCYAMTITSDHQLVFKKRCGTEFIFNSNFYVPLKEWLSVVVTSTGQKTQVYINGELYNYIDSGSAFTCERHLDIGSFSEQKAEIFIGPIEYVLVYERVIGVEEVKKLWIDGSMRPSMGIVKGVRKTTDGRPCKGACTDNARPGEVGAAPAPEGTQLGQPEPDEEAAGGGDAGGGGAKGPVNEGMPDDIPIPVEEKDTETEGKVSSSIAMQQQCKDQGTMNIFEGPTGTKFRVSCPRDCAHQAGVVIGTMIYSDDSFVCKAAVHSGQLGPEGGDVIMEISNAQPYYPGSKQNGVQSANKIGGTRSLIFSKAKKVIMLKCENTASESQFEGPPGTTFTANCPKGCVDIPINIFGVAIYSDDSSICQAAIHYGVISDRGGEISFTIEEGKPQYKAMNDNGISSSAKGEYMRSFKLNGKKGNSCVWFREGYNPPDVFGNYYRMDYMKATAGPSEWSFNKHPEKQGALSFTQASLIKGDMKAGYYGSYILRREFLCPNAVIRVNVYFKTIGQAAIVFRFANIDNYLALEFNAKESPVRLIQKEGHVVTELMGVNQYQMYPKVWYRWRIYYDGRKIKIYYQNHNIRKVFKLFQTTLEEDAWRGTVGFATQNTDGAYFDGLQVTEPDDTFLDKGEKVEFQRTWSVCMQSHKKGKRKKFCNDFYGSYQEPIKKCQELHMFCFTCCNKFINPLENVMNFQCFRTCVKNAKDAEENGGEKKEAAPKPFKEGDKVDYLPDGEEEWVKAKIKTVVNKDEEITYAVENEEGEVKEEVTPEMLKACGKQLKDRQDCI